MGLLWRGGWPVVCVALTRAGGGRSWGGVVRVLMVGRGHGGGVGRGFGSTHGCVGIREWYEGFITQEKRKEVEENGEKEKNVCGEYGKLFGRKFSPSFFYNFCSVMSETEKVAFSSAIFTLESLVQKSGGIPSRGQ